MVYMHLKLYMHEHFDLITYSNINVKLSNFYTSISKNYGECKMQFMNNEFNNIQSEWFNSYVNVNNSRNVKKSLTQSDINVRH